MPGLVTALRRHSRIGLDASVFIYWLEDAPNYADLSEIVLVEMSSGAVTGFTSSLTLMEIAVRPLQIGRNEVAIAYDYQVRSLPNLSIVDIGVATVQRAAELRAVHRLQPIDAVHIAACLERRATAFVTNDRRLRRVTEIEVLIFDNFLPAGSLDT